MRAGRVRWPQLLQPESAVYTVSQGVNPAGAVVTALPQPNLPAMRGSLILDDGVGRITLRDCKIDRIREERTQAGVRWVITILDRRWKWRTTGILNGAYNVPDSAGDVTRPPAQGGPFIRFPTQYLPWSVRTAKQLCELCLLAMGERRFQVDVPVVTVPLPTVNWNGANPAIELERLAEKLGAVVCLDHTTNTVRVMPKGKGGILPDGHIESESPSVNAPEAPSAIVCKGAPITFQARLPLAAVGREWNGGIAPLDTLTYRPDREAKPQVCTIEPSNVTTGDDFTVEVDQLAIVFQATASTVANVTAGLTALINDKKPWGAGYVAIDNSTSITLTGPDGVPFQLTTGANNNSILEWEQTQAAKIFNSPWALASPPWFGNVQATDRLTLAQARRLAEESVYKWYRIENIHQFDRTPGMVIPGYGKLARREQLIILDTQIEHVTPEKGDEKITGPDGLPIIRDFYEGYQRNKPARCYGSYQPNVASHFIDTRFDADNTTADAEVLEEFRINPDRYLVEFVNPIWRRLGDGQIEPAKLALQTSVHVRNPETNEVEHYYKTFRLGGNQRTRPAVISRPDIKHLVHGTYEGFDNGDRHQLLRVIDNELEVADRAEYYLREDALRYRFDASLDRIYSGIVPIRLDGAVGQITWIIGQDGATTQASRNSEHALYVPSFIERLRIANLPSVLDVVGEDAARVEPSMMVRP